MRQFSGKMGVAVLAAALFCLSTASAFAVTSNQCKTAPAFVKNAATSSSCLSMSAVATDIKLR